MCIRRLLYIVVPRTLLVMSIFWWDYVEWMATVADDRCSHFCSFAAKKATMNELLMLSVRLYRCHSENNNTVDKMKHELQVCSMKETFLLYALYLPYSVYV